MSIKIGVVGVGAMGMNHARVCAELPGAVLAGVADQTVGAAEAAVGRYGGRAYGHYRDLLDGEKLDALVIAVPTVDHYEVATAAIARGIHLLIEKPIAYTVEEAEKIIAAAEQAGVCLMVGHIERFNPAVIALKARLEAGELGRIFQIDAHRQGPFPARVKDVGVVIDLAVHDLDVMRYITGAEINRLFAETERRIHSSREDLFAGLVRFDDGAVGTLNINWLTPTKIRELFVTGEQGMFRVDYLTQDLYFYENGLSVTEEWPLRVLRGVSEGRMIRHVVPKREPLRNELEAFTAAVRGEAPVVVTGQDGLTALRLAEAVVSSGQTYEVVRL